MSPVALVQQLARVPDREQLHSFTESDQTGPADGAA